MPRAPIVEEEMQRLRAVQRLQQLHPSTLADLPGLVEAAKLACRAQGAGLVLLSADELIPLACVGIEEGDLRSSWPLLAALAATATPIQVPDLRTHSQAAGLRLLGTAPGQGFAAHPLLATEGVMGALIVTGPAPFSVETAALETLGALAGQALARLELAHRLSGLLATERELTRQLERVRGVRERLRLLQPAIEQAEDALLIASARPEPKGPQIVYVNRALCQLTGWEADKLLGQSPLLLAGPRTAPATMEEMARELRAGRDFSGQAVAYCKNGRELVLEWHASPVRDESRQVTHWVSILRDVTEPATRAAFLRRLEESLQEF